MQKKKAKGTYTEIPEKAISDRKEYQEKCGVLKARGRRKESSVLHTTGRPSKRRVSRRPHCSGAVSLVMEARKRWVEWTRGKGTYAANRGKSKTLTWQKHI